MLSLFWYCWQWERMAQCQHRSWLEQLEDSTHQHKPHDKTSCLQLSRVSWCKRESKWTCQGWRPACSMSVGTGKYSWATWATVTHTKPLKRGFLNVTVQCLQDCALRFKPNKPCGLTPAPFDSWNSALNAWNKLPPCGPKNDASGEHTKERLANPQTNATRRVDEMLPIHLVAK